MTIPVSNTSLANTFSHWLTRTNEMATAMSFNVVTVGGNPAVGNAVVHGVFSANTVRIDTVRGFSGANVSIESANFIIANTASVTSIGALNVNGQLNVGSVSTIKIQGSNTTHRVLSSIDSNGTIGFIQVAFPLDQLTDVDTSNIVGKDNETIMKWSVSANGWVANTLSLINSTRINSLNVGTVTSILTVANNVVVGNNILNVNISNGRVGIGTNSPSTALSVAGTIHATGDIQGFQTSDASFKKNVRTLHLENAIDLLMKIRIVEFDWDEEKLKDSKFAAPDLKGTSVGVLAQELQKIKPEWVSQRPDGTLAVNYDAVIPYLIAGIQQIKST